MNISAGSPTDLRRPVGLLPATFIQKALHPALAGLYLGNIAVPGRFEPHRVAGFAVRGQDARASGAGELIELYGLDKIPGWPVGGPVYLLRFRAYATALFSVPLGGRDPHSAASAGTSVVYPPPFLGTGYTPSTNYLVPEYFMELLELPAGAELWRVNRSGTEERIGHYVHRQIGWIPASAAEFDRSRWQATPVPLDASIRRGLTARHRGQDFDADFGPGPGEVTLHPLAGDPVPRDFDTRQGTHSLVVPDIELDSLSHLRRLCTWRDAPFELLDLVGEQAVLHFLGEDYDLAHHLGLTEVDYRVWRAWAPAAELRDVIASTRAVPQRDEITA